MRKLILTLLAVGGLVLGGSAPAFAAPPDMSRFSGHVTSLFSESQDCGLGGVCDLNAFIEDNGTAVVCLDILGEDNFEFIDSGCTEVKDGVISISESGATVTDTEIDLEKAGRVTVSATDDATGSSFVRSDRTVHREGDCVYRDSFKATVTPVAGTLIVEGQGYPETGEISDGDYRHQERCA